MMRRCEQQPVGTACMRAHSSNGGGCIEYTTIDFLFVLLVDDSHLSGSVDIIVRLHFEKIDNIVTSSNSKGTNLCCARKVVFMSPQTSHAIVDHIII